MWLMYKSYFLNRDWSEQICILQQICWVNQKLQKSYYLLVRRTQVNSFVVITCFPFCALVQYLMLASSTWKVSII